MLYILLLLFCIIFPEITITSTKETLQLWVNNILPSLFPFFVISKCILYNGGIKYFANVLSPITKILKLPNAIAFPLSMSLLCGYQTGSKTVAGMNLKNKDLFANVCFSASPIFIIGTVGTSMLKNTDIGYALYIIHVCSLIIFTVFYTKNNTENYNFQYEKGTYLDAVTSSISSILNVFGFMAIYNLSAKIITTFLPEKYSLFISGIIEFTSGIKASTELLLDPLPIISFFLSFGGICVISQCLSNYDKINKTRFIINRFICGLISFFLCLIYKKTALYMPIIITAVAIIVAHIFRRK